MNTVYVTKYALTAGIKTMETDSDITGRMIAVKESLGYTNYLHGDDWHTIPEKALARAEEMRLRKIDSLEKSLKRIRALSFALKSLDRND